MAEVHLPADCLSIQEIGTVAGAALVLTWFALLVTALFMAFKAVQSEGPIQHFYYLNAFICGTATFSYFAMFSGMGWETVAGCRQFFYIRYLEQAVTGSLIIFALGLLAEQDWATVFAVMGANVGMVYAFYTGAVVLVPLAKWLWFFLGVLMVVPIVIALLREFRQTILDKNNVDRIELYSRVSLLTMIVLCKQRPCLHAYLLALTVSTGIYPLVWIMGVGISAVGVSMEVIFNCILDLFQKVVFAYMLVNVGLYESVPVTQREAV